jgi:hypothetical protein
MDDICMGPFLRTVKQDGTYDNDIINVNEWFMEALFQLMPAVVGSNIWRGTVRCGRHPNYSRNKTQVGTIEEMVTLSDQAFICWGVENCYMAVTTEMENYDLLEDNWTVVKPKWTRNATRRFGGWSDHGKTKWNTLMIETRERWNRKHPAEMDIDEWPKARFVKEFEDRWFRTHGLSRQGGSGNIHAEPTLSAVHDMVLNIEEL